MIVSKLMYVCGARECDDLEVIQNGFGRWLWKVGNVDSMISSIRYSYNREYA